MVERRPLVLISGEVEELPSGDSLPGGAGGGDQAAASFYDNTGAQNISSSVWTVVNIDTTKRNNATGVYSLASDEVTINETADYYINYACGGQLAGGTRAGLQVQLEVDTGSGFTVVDGTIALCYGRITSEDMGSANGSIVMSLNSGDKVRLVAQGTSQALRYYCRLFTT